MKVLFPRTFNGMERSYTNSETTARLARAFGIETDVDDYVVHLKSRPGFMEVTVAAKYRMAELKLYHSFGKTVVRETNTNVGLQICTTWDRTTNELSRFSRKYDVHDGPVGEAVPMQGFDSDCAIRRVARMTRSAKQVLEL